MDLEIVEDAALANKLCEDLLRRRPEDDIRCPSFGV